MSRATIPFATIENIAHRGRKENFILAPNTRRENSGELCIFLMAFICVGFFTRQIMAQGVESSAPDMFRSASELRAANESTRDANDLSRSNDPNQIRRYNSTGKPCIALESFVTNQLINKKIFEHWIKASNSCGQNIKIQVCYHKTEDCIDMIVPPWESKNAVLGIYPNVKEFQYDAKEKK